MRLSYLAASVLTGALLSISTSAGASCTSTNTCTATSHNSGHAYSSYGSGYTGSYGSSYISGTPYLSGTSYSSGYTGSYGSSYTMSDLEADTRYGSGTISAPYTDGDRTIIPFTTTTANVTNLRVPGMGSNEFLTPTSCPVNVFNPEGGKVLGCYSVSKPAPKPVVHVTPSYRIVRVVRPIIYVRYPVPTPLAVPYIVPHCNRAVTHYSRYYQNWPHNHGRRFNGCYW